MSGAFICVLLRRKRMTIPFYSTCFAFAVLIVSSWPNPQLSRSEDSNGAAMRAALEDAHARIRRLGQENAQLNRELGEAHAARDLAGERVNRLLGDLYASIERAGMGATTLEKTAAQLAGTERFLKMQNDAVRLQASGEADALRAQNGQLRERIDHLLLEVDQYRRAVVSDRGKTV